MTVGLFLFVSFELPVLFLLLALSVFFMLFALFFAALFVLSLVMYILFYVVLLFVTLSLFNELPGCREAVAFLFAIC